MRQIVSLSLVLTLLFSGCLPLGEKGEKTSSKSENGNGLVRQYYPSGELRVEVNLKDGHREGLAREYYRNGKLAQEIMYVHGIKHGTAKRFYEDGKLYLQTPYDSGKIHGVQMKYRENGKLSAEIPYDHGEEVIGLKEYFRDGSLKTDYPFINAQFVDDTWKGNRYLVRLSMSDQSRNVTFYEGKLTNGKYIGDEAERIARLDGRGGAAQLTYDLPPGGFIMEEVNIIARVRTLQGNYYITQKKIHVAAKHLAF